MKYIFLIILTFYSHAAYSTGIINKYARSVSIVSLVATPEKYDSVMVRVEGVGLFQFESSFICLNMDALNYNMLSNCLKVGVLTEDVQLSAEKILGEYHGEYISLEGVFEKPLTNSTPQNLEDEHGGHTREITYSGIPVGMINKINRFEKLIKISQEQVRYENARLIDGMRALKQKREQEERE